MSIEDLNNQIKLCRKCGLWENAQNAVVGEGPRNAKIMLIGQNPGIEEDKTGKPFVGRAGKFLNKVLEKNGIDREKVFITNIVRHLTPKNRKPSSDELAICAPYLVKQIRLVNPRIVVLMGAVAWQTPEVENVKYFKTVHPSAAMRFTKMRKRFEADFAKLEKMLQLEIH